MNISKLKEAIRIFDRKRNWSKFHSPKNLAIGVSVEASELLEIFIWLSDKESANLSKEQKSALKEEIGDVLIYLTNLCDKYDLDPLECAFEKIKINERKYPAELSKGNCKKYNDL